MLFNLFFRSRCVLRISALSTCVGKVVAYHCCYGYRGIRVRFRRGSLRNGYHFQGRQQGRKLPNSNSGEVVTTFIKNHSLWMVDWNERVVMILLMTHWRTSLVPAPAVIPAPIVYIKVVAVKKLVVYFYNYALIIIISF